MEGGGPRACTERLLRPSQGTAPSCAVLAVTASALQCRLDFPVATDGSWELHVTVVGQVDAGSTTVALVSRARGGTGPS